MLPKMNFTNTYFKHRNTQSIKLPWVNNQFHKNKNLFVLQDSKQLLLNQYCKSPFTYFNYVNNERARWYKKQQSIDMLLAEMESNFIPWRRSESRRCTRKRSRTDSMYNIDLLTRPRKMTDLKKIPIKWLHSVLNVSYSWVLWTWLIECLLITRFLINLTHL